jgi:uncharacterized phage-associated protein
MTTVHDVMAYIEKQLPHASAMELQKFAYYVQAWHVTWEGAALYPEEIQAWRHGPVCREAWKVTKLGIIPKGKPLPEPAEKIVDAVLAFYGHLGAAQLRAMTHTEGPWINARAGLPDDAWSDAEIPVRDMRLYYTRKTILGEHVPLRPSDEHLPSVESTLRIADEEIVRWRGVLDELAAR